MLHWNCCKIKTCWLVITKGNSRKIWSNLCSIFVIKTTIIIKNIENMVIIPRSCHESCHHVSPWSRYLVFGSSEKNFAIRFASVSKKSVWYWFGSVSGVGTKFLSWQIFFFVESAHLLQPAAVQSEITSLLQGEAPIFFYEVNYHLSSMAVGSCHWVIAITLQIREIRQSMIPSFYTGIVGFDSKRRFGPVLDLSVRFG